MVTFIVISTQTLASVDGRYPVRTMSSKEATQVGIPTWDSANVPEGGRSMLTISATIFVGQNKGTHPELVKYFMYMARDVTGVPAGEEVVTLATQLAAAEAALATATTEAASDGAAPCNDGGDGGDGGDSDVDTEQTWTARKTELTEEVAEMKEAVAAQATEVTAARKVRLKGNAEVPSKSVLAKREKFSVRNYVELTDSERSVDGAWFAKLVTNIVGPARDTCQQVGEGSFVKAWVACSKELTLSAHSAKTEIMRELSAVVYNNDPKELLASFRSLVQQVYDEEITIEDILMQRLLEIMAENEQARIWVAMRISEGSVRDMGHVKKSLNELCAMLETQKSASSASGINRIRAEPPTASEGSQAALVQSITKQVVANMKQGMYEFKGKCFACGKSGHRKFECSESEIVKAAYAKKSKQKVAKVVVEKVEKVVVEEPAMEQDEFVQMVAELYGIIPVNTVRVKVTSVSVQEQVAEVGAAYAKRLQSSVAKVEIVGAPVMVPDDGQQPAALTQSDRDHELAAIKANLSEQFHDDVAKAMNTGTIPRAVASALRTVLTKVQAVMAGAGTFTLDSAAGVSCAGPGVLGSVSGPKLKAEGFEGSIVSSSGSNLVSIQVGSQAEERLTPLRVHEIPSMKRGELLISLGDLIATRLYEVHLSYAESYILEKSTEKKFPLKFGRDNILTGNVQKSVQGSATRSWATVAAQAPAQPVTPVTPPVQVRVARKVMASASAAAMHRVWNHPPEGRLQALLLGVSGMGMMTGSKMPPNCAACAVTKVHKKPLKHKAKMEKAAKAATPSNRFAGLLLDAADSTDDVPTEVQPSARSTGPRAREVKTKKKKAAAKQQYRGHKVDPLEGKPYGQIYVDNFKFCGLLFLMIICTFSLAVWTYQIPAKSANGLVMKQWIADEGVAHRPYPCTVHSDGCGSMVHVRNAAHTAGLKYVQLPPGSQSLNDAETAINYIQENALAHMAESNLPHRVVPDILWETSYIWNRSAKATRWDCTPYDLLGKGRTPDGVVVKPSRAYDVPIGSFGAVTKIEKKSPAPGISIFEGGDPMPGNRGLVCRFIRHASMWDPTGSTHRVLLYDRVTRTGALIKRTSRNVVYEHPDHPWHKSELVRVKGAAQATLPWEDHADGKRYRREQLQNTDVPPPPSQPLATAEPQDAPGTTPESSPLSSAEPSPMVTPRYGRSRTRLPPNNFTDYRQEFRSEQHKKSVRAAQNGGDMSGSEHGGTNSDGSSEGEDQHDGRESPGGTTVEAPTALSLPFVQDSTNEMKIINRELASRRESVKAATAAQKLPTTGVRFKEPCRPVDSSGSSDADASDGDGEAASTSAGTSGQQTTPAASADAPVHKVVPTHTTNMAKRTMAMERALATGDIDGFSSLVQSIAICEVEELVAETGPLDPSKIGHSASQHVAHILGLRSVNRVKQKKNSNADLNWNVHLDDPSTREEVLTAYDAEVEGLLKTIFTELQPDDPEYEIALERGTRSRALLAKKRSGKYKSRVVKLGHLEDKVQADGLYFNYCAHVTSLKNIRMILSKNMKGKCVAVIDVSQAFAGERLCSRCLQIYVVDV